MVNPCSLGGFWHVQDTKCWPFGWIGHIPFHPFWIHVDLLGGIDTDSWEFWPDIDLLGGERPHFYNHFEYVDLLGGWKKSFQTVFADVDLLGGTRYPAFNSFFRLLTFWVVHPSARFIKGFSSEKLGILAGFHPKNQDSRLDFQSKCWPFRWEVLTFWMGSVDFLGGKCWPFGWEVLTFWVGSVDLLGGFSSVINCISAR